MVFFYASFNYKILIKNNFILFLLLFTSLLGFNQEVELLFIEEIKTLNTLGKEIIGANNDEDKQNANSKFKTLLKTVLKDKNSFQFSFDSLKTVSVLKADDQLKIYNWTLPKTDGTYEYFAFLQVSSKKDGLNIIELFDKSDEIKTPENKILTTKSWYGALYYKVISDKKLGANKYTLLGWDGNNMLTNKKIIDVITISGNGMIKFGAPIFKMDKKTKRRLIFEYAEEAVMSLKYHPKIKKIIFNQLDPMSSHLKDIPAYRVPNLKYFDALIIDNRKWVLEKNTKITQHKTIKDRYFHDPALDNY